MTPLIDKLIYPSACANAQQPMFHPSFIDLHCAERFPALANFEYVQSLGLMVETRVPDCAMGLRFLSFHAVPVMPLPAGLIRCPDDADTLLRILAPDSNPAQAVYTAGAMDLVLQLVGTGGPAHPALTYARANPYIRLGVGLRAAERVGCELERFLVRDTHPDQRGYVTPGQLSSFVGDLLVIGAMAAVLITNTTEQMLMQSPETTKAGSALMGSRLGDRIRSALAQIAKLWVVARTVQLTIGADMEVHRKIIDPETARTYRPAELVNKLWSDMAAAGVPLHPNGVPVFSDSGMWASWNVRVDYQRTPQLSAWGHRFGVSFLRDNDPETWWTGDFRPPTLMSQEQGSDAHT